MHNLYFVCYFYSVPRSSVYSVPFSMCRLYYTYFYFSRLFLRYILFFYHYSISIYFLSVLHSRSIPLCLLHGHFGNHHHFSCILGGPRLS